MSLGIAYGPPPLLLDLHRPQPGAWPVPVVLFLHGGGWQGGSRAVFCPTWRDWRPDPFARLVAAGFAVVSADYRLSGEAVFPAQLDDVRAALEWVRTRGGDLGLDPDRVVLWGESAGGHLAALLGLTATRERPGSIAGVVDWYGPSDLSTMGTAPGSREARLLGEPVSAAAVRPASPVHHVHPWAPPFHLAHGTADRLVPPGQSRQLAGALRAAGAPAELHLHEGAGHLWQGAKNPEAILTRAVSFAHHVTT